MALSRVISPTFPDLLTATQLIPLATAKKQIRQEAVADDDDFIATVLIPAAIERAEIATRRGLLGQTWDFSLDRVPADYIEIPKPPLIRIESISYIDTAGVSQPWVAGATGYLLDAPKGPRCARARLTPAYGTVWPVGRWQINALTVRFTCGYASSDVAPVSTLPPLLLSAILMDIGALYENRESLIADPKMTGVIPLPMFASWIYKSFRSWPRKG